jgi:hypothetical protein
MKRALVLLALVLATSAGAAARKKPKPKPKPAPAAPAPAPEAAPTPAADPTPASAPPPTPPPAPTPSAAPGANAAPGAAQPPPAPPKMAMRAHDGFVDNMDCSACHTSDGWQLAATAGQSGFDHDRTGFPLRGAHVQTTCVGCHTGQAKIATTCEGCHRDPHEGRHVGACAECHEATAWSNTSVLEQHRRTRMPLTGRHAMIDCSDCHKRQGARQFSATPTDCYACHAAQYHDQTIHPTHDGSTGQAPFPRDCALCHQTSAFSPAYAAPSTLPRMAPGVMNRQHDPFFVLSTGSHRNADCASCHADVRRPQQVRCDGCHADVKLRTQHRVPVARAAAGCLGCHPRGASR